MKSQQTLLQVAQLGNPVIRRKCRDVVDLECTEMQKFIDDLIFTVMDVDGVGISAPQVYRSLNLFILASHPNPRYPNAPVMRPAAIINPVILSFSEETEKDWEGCLSIPGIRGKVPRYVSVLTEYTTRSGKRVRKKFEGFVARIFQHEYDHLQGIVFLDRVESTKDLVTEKEYQKIVKKPHSPMPPLRRANSTKSKVKRSAIK